MKIDKNLPIDIYNQFKLSNSFSPQSSSEYGKDKNPEDVVELSMSGVNRSQRLTVSMGKQITAGLIITGLQISGGIGSVSASTATVSNEKAALGASENILGYNSPSIGEPPKALDPGELRIRDIEKAKEMAEGIKRKMLQQSTTSIVAQGNSKSDSVIYLLR